eukprot:7379043-Prymnesium_polylepis.2
MSPMVDVAMADVEAPAAAAEDVAPSAVSNASAVAASAAAVAAAAAVSLACCSMPWPASRRPRGAPARRSASEDGHEQARTE